MRLLVPALILLAAAPNETRSLALHLNLRSRVEAFKGSGAWQEVHFRQTLPVRETAILICDMWDNHWCKGAAQRVDVIARKMAPLVDQARDRGIQIIHAPSDVMDFYKDSPHRRLILELPRIEPPAALPLTEPPLPVDASDGGCDTPGDKTYKAWSRQHALLRIAGSDVVSDRGAEIYSLLRQRGIRNLLVMGVHTNMCVLTRSFAIRQMTKWGIRCALVRDLTDAMYDPQDAPHVGHDQGTALVVEHIEKHWCPSLLSADLSRAIREAK